MNVFDEIPLKITGRRLKAKTLLFRKRGPLLVSSVIQIHVFCDVYKHI